MLEQPSAKSSIRMVEPLTTDPEIKGSNPVTARQKEKITKKKQELSTKKIYNQGGNLCHNQLCQSIIFPNKGFIVMNFSRCQWQIPHLIFLRWWVLVLHHHWHQKRLNVKKNKRKKYSAPHHTFYMIRILRSIINIYF